MKVFIHFVIVGSAEPAGFPSGAAPHVPDIPAYTRMVELCRDRLGCSVNRPPGDPDSILSVDAPLDDPALEDLYRLLQDAGWVPYFGLELPDALRGSAFQVYLRRCYDPDEIDRAPYFSIEGWGECIAAFAGRDGERWIGSPVLDDPDVWQMSIGFVDGGQNYFVNSEVRDRLQQTSLNGLRFFPLIWDHPKHAHGDFWELSASHVMPPCLLPTRRIPVSTRLYGTIEYCTVYDDGAVRRPELVFRREEVEAMGPFDIALTREELAWTKPNVGHHRLIVSQAFRKTLADLSINQVTYGMVHLPAKKRS